MPPGDVDAAFEDPPAPESLRDVFWARHANPASGYSRMAVTPVLFYAIYHRRWRLLVAAVCFLAVNPILFSRPDSTDNWMSNGVLGERAWIEDGHGTFGLSYPNLLNRCNLPVFGYALSAAVRRRPVGTLVGYLVSTALKLRFVDEMSKYYVRTRRRDES